MYLGYLIYIPEFGSYVDLYYKMIIRFQFLIVSIACAVLVFISGRWLGQNISTSTIIYILSGWTFAWYRPEVGQYHWAKALFEFHAIYILIGVLAVITSVILRKRRKKENR
jgi:uncharacterized membrane protein